MSYGYRRIERPSFYGGVYGFYGEPTLSYSTRSSNPTATRELQRLLISKGFGPLLGSTQDDGDFGSKTKAAVMAYQAAVGLPATGVADQATWDSLKGVSQSGGSPDPGDSADSRSGGGQKKSPWSFVADFVGGVAEGIGGSDAGSGVSGTIVPSGGTGVSTQDKKKFPWGWVLGGVGVVTVAGIGIYFATRKK